MLGVWSRNGELGCLLHVLSPIFPLNHMRSPTFSLKMIHTYHRWNNAQEISISLVNMINKHIASLLFVFVKMEDLQ